MTKPTKRKILIKLLSESETFLYHICDISDVVVKATRRLERMKKDEIELLYSEWEGCEWMGRAIKEAEEEAAMEAGKGGI